LTKDSRASKKLFLDHGFDREGVLLSETGGIFTATYALFEVHPVTGPIIDPQLGHTVRA
jgi:hypothetical protein